MVNGYRHDYKTAKSMVEKAIRMAGRGMDITTPSEQFKWEGMAEAMVIHWKNDDAGWNYQLMVELERDLVDYVREELIMYTHQVIVENL